jgi:hypothetical protein
VRHLGERSGIAGRQQFAVRDLKLIDGAMAQMAELLGLSITDYDTVPVGSGSSGSTAAARPAHANPGESRAKSGPGGADLGT